MTQHKGKCDCGVVEFVCKGEPLFTQYCHCNKCREISALSTRDVDKSGYAYTAAYFKSDFNIISGSDHLDEIIKNNAKLFSCKSCHSLIYGISIEQSKHAGIGINANNFCFIGSTPESFKPVRHVWYSNRIVNFDDDLPKYIDAPEDQFGSGELYFE
ncbi:GFA family protein [Legionella yabuuchiae]|uniref:GFA family protein n=1 Tax=Legionella yabuuchiae TaxID=376727 RepID=UPI001054CA61|nr:hypothetical protein [Legionella yabuuchiae]